MTTLGRHRDLLRAARWLLVAAALVATLSGANARAAGPYNTTDPTVFAPHCQDVLHRSYRHCLDGASVGQVTLTGNTHTIDVDTGAVYRFALDTPPRCKAPLKKGIAPCTVRIDWGLLFGASLARWGPSTLDTIEAHRLSGCGTNDRECEFDVRAATPTGSPLPQDTALRITTVARVVGLPCGTKTTTGYCDHWEDWPLRLNAVSDAFDIAWTMPDRLTETAAEHWADNSYGLPSSSFVDPKTWEVDLFVTKNGKPSCPSGVTYQWTISGQGETQTLLEHGCRVAANVRELGKYTVTAEELKSGKPTGVKAVDNAVDVRDWLIVALGDSNGSGQGSPPYIYPQCDRSVVSYQYQTALYIEDHDPHSSVTFLWPSCSGARSDQVWRNTYVGQEEAKGTTLPTQLDQIRSRLVPSRRKIDAVIMSVGINDLFFGPIMGFCTTYDTVLVPQVTLKTCERAHVEKVIDSQGYLSEYTRSDGITSPTLAQETADKVSELPTDFRKLNEALRRYDPAHIFATQYPNETTDETGQICDGTGPRPRLSAAVWGWLAQVGAELNGAVAGTRSLGWIPVMGIPEDFVKHGYCSTQSFFRTVTASTTSQWNAYGSFHATADGAAITFTHTRDAVCTALYGNTTCSGAAK